jgi:hypothetical protein
LVQPKRVALTCVSAAIVAMAFRTSVAQPPQGAATPAPLVAQQPTTARPVASQPAAAQPAAAQPAAPVVPVTTQLQPALNAVHQAVSSVRVDKWKRGNIRDEAAQNIGQIQRDIDVSLPPLMRDADTSPASLSKLLPVSRNISALYDVLLRVVEAARVIAPDDQVEQLQKALVTLGNARLAFSDRMQSSAVAMEKQVTDLRTTVAAQADKIAAATTVAAVPCTPPPHTTPKKTTHKPAAKTTGTKATTSSGSATQPAQQNPPQQNPH